MQDSFVSHTEIANFAKERVDLKMEDVKAYRAQVNRLRDKLDDYISEHPGFDLVKMLHSGSVAKGTALKTINDMDVAVYVKASKAPEDEKQLINWLMARLKEAYGKVLNDDQFSPQHHCVTVSFRGSGLDVDVVPVLYEGAENDYGYLVAQDTGQRVLTSIPLHLKFTRARKQAHPHRYRQMVRLVKWWARAQKNEREGFRFKSFMTELLMAHLFDSGKLDGKDFAESLQQFFAYLVRSRLQDTIIFGDYYDAGSVTPSGAGPIKIIDPVNAANNVAALYTTADRDLILEAAEDAVDSIAFARRATSKGQAVAEWQKILGTTFKGS